MVNFVIRCINLLLLTCVAPLILLIDHQPLASEGNHKRNINNKYNFGVEPDFFCDEEGRGRGCRGGVVIFCWREGGNDIAQVQKNIQREKIIFLGKLHLGRTIIVQLAGCSQKIFPKKATVTLLIFCRVVTSVTLSQLQLVKGQFLKS